MILKKLGDLSNMAMEDILSVIEQGIQQYSPGGTFAKARGEQLAEKKGRYIPSAISGLTKAGLSGTTVRSAIPTRFEQEVAKPFQTETELLRTERLMQAILAKAGLLEKQEQRDWEAKQREEDRKAAIEAAGGAGGTGAGGGSARAGFLKPGSRTVISGGGGGYGDSASPSWDVGAPSAGVQDTGGTGASYGGTGTGYSGSQYDPNAYAAPPEGVYIAGQGIVPAGSQGYWSTPEGIAAAARSAALNKMRY